MKRKAETLTKEKEELIKESQALSKQLEESKQGKIQSLYWDGGFFFLLIV